MWIQQFRRELYLQKKKKCLSRPSFYVYQIAHTLLHLHFIWENGFCRLTFLTNRFFLSWIFFGHRTDVSRHNILWSIKALISLIISPFWRTNNFFLLYFKRIYRQQNNLCRYHENFKFYVILNANDQKRNNN